MSEQQAIPIADPLPSPLGACRWCGEPAVMEFKVEPPKKNAKGLITKRAITAPVCRQHRDRFLAERTERRVQKVREEKKAWSPPKIV